MIYILSRTLLGAAGGLLIVIGVGVLFQPHAFSAANGVVLGTDPSHLSEIRAPGGFLIGSALVMILGVGRDRFTQLGLALAAAVYGSYGLSRLVSLVVEGVPSTPLVQALIIELVVGALCLIAFLHLRSVSPK